MHQRDRRRATGRWLCLGLVLAIAALAAFPRAGLGADDVDWRARFEAKIEELRAEGQPVTFEEVLARREQIPDEENSALVFLQAFELIEAVEGKIPSAPVLDLAATTELGERHSESAREMIGGWVEANADALKLIHKGAQLPHGRFPIAPAENPYAIELPHLDSLRRAARLCVWQAVSHAEAGEGRAAAEGLFATGRLAASLGDNVFLIDALLRIALDAMLIEGWERTLALCEMPADRLALLRHELWREEQELSLTQAFVSERAAGHYFFAETSPEDLRRTLHDLMGESALEVLADPNARAREALHYYDLIEGAIRVSRMGPRQRLTEAKRWAQDVERERHTFQYQISDMLLPALRRAVQEEVKGNARLRTARAALAVEEWRLGHGSWPDSLEQLVPELLDAVPEDPFSDGKLRYERQEEGVVVYSVGPDGEDDAGLPREEAEREAGRVLDEGWDITFRLLDPERRGARTLSFREEVTVDGRTVLHLAAQGGNTKVAQALLAEGAELNAEDEGGRTPLHYAAEAGHTETVRLLLDGGAEVNAVDYEGRTPTGLAFERGHDETADLLREHGGVQ